MSKTYLPNSSNLDPVPTFGFRGEGMDGSLKSSPHLFVIDWDSALASAADILCLEIWSHTTKSRNTSSIILKVWNFNIWFADFYKTFTHLERVGSCCMLDLLFAGNMNVQGP